MKRRVKALTAAFLSLTMLGIFLPSTNACAPELESAIMISGFHPDLPLNLFASGNIGILQPSWARSYLCVYYRYLIGKPLSKAEQESMIRLWLARLKRGTYNTENWMPGCAAQYIGARAKALGQDPEKDKTRFYSKVDSWAYEKGIGDTAFNHAKDKLNLLVKRFGARSPQVKAWLEVQDNLFGFFPGVLAVPSELPKNADPMLKSARIYQMGAAYFYLGDFFKAEESFKAIALDKSSPDSSLARYLVARCQSNNVDGQSEQADATAKRLSALADSMTTASERDDILDLQRPFSYVGRSTPENIRTLAANIVSGNTKRFGGDVGDISFLMGDYSDDNHAVSNEKNTGNDMVKWIDITQRGDPEDSGDAEKVKEFKTQQDESNKCALDNWRKTKSIPWLVAAISGLGLRSADRDLVNAANDVSPASSAFLTCKFYVIDRLIADKKTDEARKQLTSILSLKNLPPTTFNLFTAQMAATSTSPYAYLKNAVLKPAEILTTTQVVSSDLFKLEKTKVFHNEPPAYDDSVAKDINRNAPLSLWIKLAQTNTLSPGFRSLVLRNAWMRAQLLNKPDLASKLESDLALLNPILAAPLKKYQAAATDSARRFALACLVLRNFGMAPYMDGGAERHAVGINEFDWYNGNFWQPLEVTEKPKSPDEDYYSSYENTVGFSCGTLMKERLKNYWNPGLNARLSPAEKKAAESERRTLLANHPSRFFGQAVLEWAKTHPQDKDLPEMLYRVVRLPKWAEWSPTGSEFSKKAWVVLHSHYPGNTWTKKAVCYY